MIESAASADTAQSQYIFISDSPQNLHRTPITVLPCSTAPEPMKNYCPEKCHTTCALCLVTKYRNSFLTAPVQALQPHSARLSTMRGRRFRPAARNKVAIDFTWTT